MDIKLSGSNDYFSGVREKFIRQNNIEVKRENVKFVDNGFLRDAVTLNKNQEERAESLKKVKSLLEDLKNTELVKDSNALSQFSLDIVRNNGGIKAAIEDADALKKDVLTINITKLPQETKIASDDISSLENIGFSGSIEINGIQIMLQQQDTQNTLVNKLNYGEDLNKNEMMETGEDLNKDKELITESDMQTKAYYSDGKIVVSSKDIGSDAYINLEGSSSILGDTLGFVDSEGQLKNIVSEGNNGEIDINGNKVVLTNNEVSINGIKIDLSQAVEGEESVIEIKYDEEKVMSKIKDFQKKYNDLLDYLNNSIKNENSDIKDIRNKVYIQSNKEAGLEVQKGKFYDTLLSLKNGIGGVINDSLKAGGLVSDNEGKVQIDIEKIKNNLDNIRQTFKTENNETIFSGIEKQIQPYFEKVNLLDIKEQVTNKSLEGLNSKIEKKSKMEEIRDENRKINQKIKLLAEELQLDTNIIYGSKRKDKIENDKIEKEKNEKEKNVKDKIVFKR